MSTRPEPVPRDDDTDDTAPGPIDRGSWTTLSGTRLFRRHPGVRAPNQLTRGERAADAMRNGMGSWAFVFVALTFLAMWMLGNRTGGFDPYPFILLNLVLSCVAALQGAILLIAGKRSDQIASELALNDYHTDEDTLAELTEVRQALDEIRAMLEPTEPGTTAA